MSYKTNLNILNQEGSEIDTFIKSSFFQNASEQQKLNAFRTKQHLMPKIKNMKIVECEKCDPDDAINYFEVYKQLCRLNKEISYESGLKPFNLHIVNILTPKFKFKNVVVLQPSTKVQVKRNIQKYLCIYFEKGEK
jgi:hypothetical protein